MPTDTLLIEMGVEELPPGSLDKLRQAFVDQLGESLEAAGLGFTQASGYATPRRLAVMMTGLADRQPDQPIKRRGPAVNAAFDKDGKPTKALAGFMRSCGVSDAAKLGSMKTDKGEWLVYQSVQVGESLAVLLTRLLPDVLSKLPIDRRMRWGKSREEFVRPVQWFVCLYGADVLPVKVMGLEAGRMSQGHRFMRAGPFEIRNANDYIEACREEYVIADQVERKTLIQKQVQEIAAKENGQAEMDDDLLEEVTALVEWPVALIGSFDESFLFVPEEALISAMKKHQRYFHLTSPKTGKLLPRFITIANLESRDSNLVVRGNERVIRPRLADAAFFYKRDTQTSLESKLERLKQVVFQAKLGSYYDKSVRVSGLSGYVAGQQWPDAKEAAARAGLLCKADLVSDMVDEFPDLQGVMGGYYARHDREPGEVAQGIGQHYFPTYSGGPLPGGHVALSVALADKTDTLVGLFGINQPPTGSRDPFALRRQALGVIRICIEKELDLDLAALLEQAAGLYGQDFDTNALLTYLIERLENYYAEQGIAGDLVNAAVGGHRAANLHQVHEVIIAVMDFRKKRADEAEKMIAVNKRVANILRQTETDSLPEYDPSLSSDPAEVGLQAEITGTGFAQADINDKLRYLAGLQKPIDRFFDDVLVMAEDERLRKNRLALLQSFRDRFLEIADFSLLR